MRKAFIETLIELASADERIMLLTGDLGYMAFEPFIERFPKRFLNLGVAEQNMIGVATGLAEAGFLPYAYSIATFASLRPFEFIRNGPVLHHLPVRIVGMGMGFEYGHAGVSHHATEDIAILRSLPGLTIVIPADSKQAATAVRETSHIPGPIYYSLGKNDRLSVPALEGRFELGRLQVIGRGSDIAILSMGSVSAEAAAAVDQLASRGIHARLAIVANFNPDPTDDVAELLAEFKSAVTVEAQSVSGGLGAFVSTVIATQGLGCKLYSLGVRTPHDGTSGRQEDRWRKHGIDRTSIAETVLDLVGARGPARTHMTAAS